MEQKEMNKDKETVQSGEIFQRVEHYHKDGEYENHHSSSYHHGSRYYPHSSRGHRHHSYHRRDPVKIIARSFRKLNRSKKGQAILAGVTLCLFVGFLYAMKYIELKTSADTEKLQVQYHEQRIKNKELRSAMEEYMPGIVCYGSNNTANGYCGFLSKRIDNYIRELGIDMIRIPVINQGIQNANSLEVTARCGAIPYKLKNDVVIPKDQTAVLIKLRMGDYSIDGTSVGLVKDQSYSVLLGDVEGSLSVTGKWIGADNYYHYYSFIRSKSGEDIFLPKGTEMILQQKSYTGNIPVIFIGDNGGWEENTALLVEQIWAIINHIGNKQGRYLVLGSHTVDIELTDEFESVMKQEFGEQYISLREFFTNPETFKRYNYQLTENEEKGLDKNQIPSSIMMSDIQFSERALQMIGDRVFETMQSLGWFNELSEVLNNNAE